MNMRIRIAVIAAIAVAGMALVYAIRPGTAQTNDDEVLDLTSGPTVMPTASALAATPAANPLAFLNQHMFEKDGSFYAVRTIAPVPPASLQSLLQIKFQHPKVESVALSEADRMNGLSDGYLIKENSALRLYNTLGYNMTWTEWTMEDIVLAAVKLQDKWTVTQISGQYVLPLSRPNIIFLQSLGFIPSPPMQRQPPADDGSVWNVACDQPAEISGYIKYNTAQTEIGVDCRHAIKATYYPGWGVDPSSTLERRYGVTLLGKDSPPDTERFKANIGQIMVFKGHFYEGPSGRELGFVVDREIVDADAAFNRPRLESGSDEQLSTIIIGSWITTSGQQRVTTFRVDGTFETRNSPAIADSPVPGKCTWLIHRGKLTLNKDQHLWCAYTIASLTETQLALQDDNGGDLAILKQTELMK